jgi:hypothetical protein
MPISFQTVPDTEYRLMSTTDLVSRWIPCPYATTESGRPQTSVITASVDTTVLYVTPSNAIRFYLAKIDTPLTPPRDAVAYGGHFYKIFDGVISWYEAKLRCEDMGGYLACIETAGEQAFLAEQAEGRYMWLGGTDEGGSWEWINGSPWDYTSWAGGQPNNALGIEDYLEMFTGGNWNDAPNQTSDYDDLPIEIYWMPVGYICEWEP